MSMNNSAHENPPGPSFANIPRKRWPQGLKLDDGWPESEKRVFQAALSMVVVKNSRWMVDQVYMSYGGIGCEK